MDELIEKALKEHMKEDSTNKKIKIEIEHKNPVQPTKTVTKKIVSKKTTKPKTVKKTTKKPVKKKTVKKTVKKTTKKKTTKLPKEYAQLNKNIINLTKKLDLFVSVLSDAAKHMRKDDPIQRKVDNMSEDVRECLNQNQKIATGILAVADLVKENEHGEVRRPMPQPGTIPSIPKHMFHEEKGLHEIERPIGGSMPPPQMSPQHLGEQMPPPMDMGEMHDREQRIPMDEMHPLDEKAPPLPKPLDDQPSPIPMNKAPSSEFKKFKEKVKDMF